MANSRRSVSFLAGLGVPLLCGALWFRSAADAPAAPSSRGEALMMAGRQKLASAGVDPNNMSRADQVALAQRARDVASGPRPDSPTAASELEARLVRNPNDSLAHRSLAAYYRYKSRDLPKSIGHWREAMRLEPDNTALRFELGLALIMAGQRAEALRNFEQMASAPIEGSGLARKFAEEDAETGRKWVQKINSNPKIGMPRAS